MFGRENKKKELIKDLASIYEKIQREHQISPGDFPELKRMQVCGRWWCVLTCVVMIVWLTMERIVVCTALW